MSQTGIGQDQLLDLAITTRELVAPIDFDQTFKNPQYPLINFALERRRNHPGGNHIRWSLRKDASGNYRRTRPYQNDSINITDQRVKGLADVVFSDTHWGIDDREDLLNSGPDALVDEFRDREMASMEDAANGMEADLADTPTNSSDDKKPHGIPAHLLMGPAGSYEAGFKGQTLRYSDGSSTTTTVHNIDRSSSERLRNWTGLYSAINGGFVKKFSEAKHMVKANVPASFVGNQALAKSPMVGFCPLDMLLQLEDFAEKKSSGAGNEIANVDGVITIKGVPILHAPSLDKTSANDTHVVRAYEPLYVCFKPQWIFYTLHDQWARRTMRKNANNHHLVEEWCDFAYQLIAPNPRYAGFVLHKQIS